MGNTIPWPRVASSLGAVHILLNALSTGFMFCSLDRSLACWIMLRRLYCARHTSLATSRNGVFLPDRMSLIHSGLATPLKKYLFIALCTFSIGTPWLIPAFSLAHFHMAKRSSSFTGFGPS